MNLIRYRRKHLKSDPDRSIGPADADRLFAWADDPASNPIAPEDTDLTAVGSTFSRVQIALATGQPAMERARKNELWEEIMHTHQSTARTSTMNDRPGKSASNIVSGYAAGRRREASLPRRMTHRQGNWQAALNVALTVVLLLGITGIVWNRAFFDIGSGGNGSDTRPQLAMSSTVGTPESTPGTAVNPLNYIAATCNAEPRTKEAIATIIRTDKQWPQRKYLPVTTVDPQTAQQISEAAAQYIVCSSDGRGRDLESERMLFQDEANVYYRNSPQYAQSIEARKQAFMELSGIVGTDPSLYVLRGPWDFSPDVVPGNVTLEGSKSVVFPSNVMMFADGRVGAPITQLINQDSKAAKTIKNGIWGGWATFLIFSLENGHWMLDEQVSACNAQCREDSGLDQAAIDRMFAAPSPVPGSTPASTPAASPIGRVEDRDLLT